MPARPKVVRPPDPLMDQIRLWLAHDGRTLAEVSRSCGVAVPNLRRFRDGGVGLSLDAGLRLIRTLGLTLWRDGTAKGPGVPRDATTSPEAPEARQPAYSGLPNAPLVSPTPQPRAAEAKPERKEVKPTPNLPATCRAARDQDDPDDAMAKKRKMEADRKRYHPKVFAERVKAGYYS